ncbi:transposase [Shimazuella sp. AN120528]|uniref:transposase n=1 Tax=Shimazuella soli TaxID=1892854 RepID=UPI001F0E8FC3|nr:transposase [Shimazuella soli]MCH5586218.1 transposase [Shimazuella soli]
MKVLLVIGIIFLPLFLCLFHRIWPKLEVYLNCAAIVSLLIFSSIASIGVYTIIRDHTVFMTSIHGLFLNPFFLITGAYLGLYVIYRLWLILDREWK